MSKYHGRRGGRLGPHKAPAGRFTGKSRKNGSKRRKSATKKQRRAKRGSHKSKYGPT